MEKNLGRPDALNFRPQSLKTKNLTEHEATAADIHRRDPERGACIDFARGRPNRETKQRVVCAFVEQRFVAYRAGRNHPHNFALNGAFTRRWVAYLFADCHRDACSNKLGEIPVGGVVGDAAHGYWLAARLAARGERDVEYARGYFSVFVKELIKIAHAIKQEAVGVLCLDAEVLLHHWGVGA